MKKSGRRSSRSGKIAWRHAGRSNLLILKSYPVPPDIARDFEDNSKLSRSIVR
jgi:hypothetical protein